MSSNSYTPLTLTNTFSRSAHQAWEKSQEESPPQSPTPRVDAERAGPLHFEVARRSCGVLALAPAGHRLAIGRADGGVTITSWVWTDGQDATNSTPGVEFSNLSLFLPRTVYRGGADDSANLPAPSGDGGSTPGVRVKSTGPVQCIRWTPRGTEVVGGGGDVFVCVWRW